MKTYLNRAMHGIVTNQGYVAPGEKIELDEKAAEGFNAQEGEVLVEVDAEPSSGPSRGEGNEDTRASRGAKKDADSASKTE